MFNTQLPNPLRDVHRQAEAEFQNWAEVEIVQSFGEPQAEYAAIHKSAGMIDLPQRGILELGGKDRHAFLNNLLTNQIWDKASRTGLQAGHGVYAFMLNLRGQIVADMNVLEIADRTLLEMDIRLVEPLRIVLDKYLFAEQVKLTTRVGRLHQIALHGPGAGNLIGAGLDAPLRSMQTKIFDVEAIVWRDDPAGVPGYFLILPIEEARTVWMKFIEQLATSEPGKRPLRPIGWAAFNATRVEAGRSIFGIDFDGAPIASAAPGKKDEASTEAGAGALPAETGLFDRAVSVTKGCYLGQEIVARMHARGQVARKVVGVRMDGDALPIAGAQIFDTDESNVIGIVTSSTVSPILSNAAICLALVKKPHFEIGKPLRIAAEGSMRNATVTKLPFVAG